MRERIKDSERLKHILDAVNVILDNKDKHLFDEVVSDPILLFGFVKHIKKLSKKGRSFI
ncbi:MAG: hypothetical protein IKR41_08900 [Bacteroidales bacterium]|nr:hypothetical protein [Bacteroidales bacterium]